MNINTDEHFAQLQKLKVPAKRAAYSDRMAWTMALLSKLAYIRFDEESEDLLIAMASELAQLTVINETTIKERLMEFSMTLAEIGKAGSGNNDNALLKASLRAGGFDLVSNAPIYEQTSDTQVFVVAKNAGNGEDFVVVCFRGTQQVRDWITNLKIVPQEIYDPNGESGQIGNMHHGFHSAFKSVEPQIRNALNSQSIEHLPIYITGHSLGGALAVVATWYLSAQKLAACYTFGAPRVADKGLEGWFKTPIYRVVNAADPVPFVPPNTTTVWVLKGTLRALSTLFPWFGWMDWLVEKSVRLQGYRHLGDMRYLPNVNPGISGKYPGLRIKGHIGNVERLLRYLSILWANNLMPWRVTKFNIVNDPPKDGNSSLKGRSSKADRIDKYHDMARYCDKLRAVALQQNKLPRRNV